MIDEKKLIENLEKEWEELCDYSECVETLLEYVVRFIAEQTKISNWIPCSERLPKRNGEYMCTQEIYSLSSGKMIGKSAKIVEFCNGEWKQAKHLKVTAWQPLPEPYTENHQD